MDKVYQVPTGAEIVKQIERVKEIDMFGFEWHEYVAHLPFEQAKRYLKEDAKDEEWEYTPLTREMMLEKMLDYMEFAWDKANNGRSISANRSIMHYIAWVWMSGEPEFSEEIRREYAHNYNNYGKSILKKICEHYGWDWK